MLVKVLFIVKIALKVGKLWAINPTFFKKNRLNTQLLDG